MRRTIDVRKVCGIVLLAIATQVFFTDEAAGQSTDSCDLISAQWYKYRCQTGWCNPLPGPYMTGAQLIAVSKDRRCGAGGGWAGQSVCNPSWYFTNSGSPRLRRSDTNANLSITGDFLRSLQSDPPAQCPVIPSPTLQVEDSCNQNNPRLGNPCSPSSGVKYLDEVDYAGAPGLNLTRSYASTRSYTADSAPN